MASEEDSLDEEGAAAPECSNHATLNSGLPLIESLDMSVRDKAVLKIVRHLCCGLAVPEYHGVKKAERSVIAHWKREDCRAIVACILRLLSILHQSRRHTFEFLSPDCPQCSARICQSEFEIVVLLQGACGDRNIPLQTLAQVVVGAGDPGYLIMAVDELADLLENCAMRMPYFGEPSRLMA